MTDFDPYYTWLGIPKSEQPPTYYRLLGLSDFEESSDAIQNAAEMRIWLLRSKAAGPATNHCQRLLNEVARAANRLLDPTAKAAYDASLIAESKDDHEKRIPPPPPKLAVSEVGISRREDDFASEDDLAAIMEDLDDDETFALQESMSPRPDTAAIHHPPPLPENMVAQRVPMELNLYDSEIIQDENTAPVLVELWFQSNLETIGDELQSRIDGGAVPDDRTCEKAVATVLMRRLL